MNYLSTDLALISLNGLLFGHAFVRFWECFENVPRCACIENLPCLSSGVTGPHPPASPPACTAHKAAWLQAAVDWFRPKGSNLLLTLL